MHFTGRAKTELFAICTGDERVGWDAHMEVIQSCLQNSPIIRVVLKVEKKCFSWLNFGWFDFGPLRDLGVKHPMDMLALSTKSLEWESLFGFFVWYILVLLAQRAWCFSKPKSWACKSKQKKIAKITLIFEGKAIDLNKYEDDGGHHKSNACATLHPHHNFKFCGLFKSEALLLDLAIPKILPN